MKISPNLVVVHCVCGADFESRFTRNGDGVTVSERCPVCRKIEPERMWIPDEGESYEPTACDFDSVCDPFGA